ncbi:hypothetical protein [Lutibacter sp.]|jgi:hypothetical protein|uniref:hypothetical protein n=1 Tax=Lutibacter sp. TaxID=1925666 RepID=UPI001A22A06E|nr:hypothetical protein [Lutibacter sp.]MBI9040916.1 hypothetical protein [Lutibacter sp.]
MKLTCNEATTICDKSQYKQASFWEIIKLNIHLILCKKCGLYSKQNGIITKCIEKHKTDLNKQKMCLCEQEKKQMEQELKTKI